MRKLQYKIFIGKTKGKRPLGRPRLRVVDNFGINFILRLDASGSGY
jgi:hypothetical protein